MKLIDFVRTDGGREASGRDRIGKIGDCVTRATTLLQAQRQGLRVPAFAADGVTDADAFGSLYDETWHILNGLQSEYVAQSKLDGKFVRGGRGWASSVDKGTYPKVWRPAYEKVFGFTKQRLGRTKPTLTEAFNEFGPCIVSMAKHVFAILPQENGHGATFDTGDIRTYTWEACVEHSDNGRGPANACFNARNYGDCDLQFFELERKAISLWTP